VENDRPYLVVASPVSANVYVNGVLVGTTNERVPVPCGWKNVRLAEQAMPAAGQSFPLWLTEGKPVMIACTGVTTTAITPASQ